MKKIINYFKSIRISTIYKIVGVVLLIGILIWIYATWKSFKTEEKLLNNNTVLTETVSNKGENYIIVEDEENNEYKLEEASNLDIPIGSEINASINEISEIKDKSVSNNTNITNDNKDIPQTIINDKIIVNKNADEEIITYMNETDTYFKDSNLKEDVKERFIKIVDFLFYDGTINGYRLNDLTSKAKLQVLKIALSIDSKIEKYFPNYKETINSATNQIYSEVKNEIIKDFLNTTVKICKHNQELCNSAKKDFQDMKNSFAITWNFIKDLVSSGTDSIKTWYEIYSGKVS